MMKTGIKNLFVFVCICTVITLMLAITNSFTSPIIEQNQNAAANKALLEVMPEGEGFENSDLTDLSLPSTVTEVYKETSGKGYVVKLVTAGYGTDMVIMCGVDVNGIVTGAVCLSSNETLSKEKTYGENFQNKDAEGVEGVDTIGGATKTTAAYKGAVKDALNTAVILGGGSVDVRTEEEILNDNLSAALPEANGFFEKVFKVEDLPEIDEIYLGANNSGYVFVSGDKFVGTLYDGTVITEGVENAEMYTEAVNLINSRTVNDIDLSKYPELEKTTMFAYKTAQGNFVVETKGAGYGIKGGNEYHPASGEYIIVRTAITPDGKILDCFTVSEAETDGLGDACADEKFYGQFAGKTQENYTEIDAIGGATMTTDGYKQALQRAFDAVNVLKGGE